MALIMGMGVVPYMGAVVRLLPNPLLELEAFAEGALKDRVKDEAIAAASRDMMSHLINPEANVAWKLT
jgi:hypothetical protein